MTPLGTSTLLSALFLVFTVNLLTVLSVSTQHPASEAGVLHSNTGFAFNLLCDLGQVD